MSIAESGENIDLWLLPKIETTWSAPRLVSSLSEEVLTSLGSKWGVMDAPMKTRLLLSFLHLKKQQLTALQTQVLAVLELAHQDDDEWVQVCHDLVKPLLEGCASPPPRIGNTTFQQSLEELHAFVLSKLPLGFSSADKVFCTSMTHTNISAAHFTRKTVDADQHMDLDERLEVLPEVINKHLSRKDSSQADPKTPRAAATTRPRAALSSGSSLSLSASLGRSQDGLRRRGGFQKKTRMQVLDLDQVREINQKIEEEKLKSRARKPATDGENGQIPEPEPVVPEDVNQAETETSDLSRKSGKKRANRKKHGEEDGNEKKKQKKQKTEESVPASLALNALDIHTDIIPVGDAPALEPLATPPAPPPPPPIPPSAATLLSQALRPDQTAASEDSLPPAQPAPSVAVASLPSPARTQSPSADAAKSQETSTQAQQSNPSQPIQTWILGSTRLSDEEKRICVLFLQGNKENPHPDQGPVRTFSVEENVRSSEKGEHLESIVFQIDYEKCSWKKLRRRKNLKAGEAKK